VQAQAPLDGEVASFPDRRALKTESCFSTAVLSQLGQMILSRLESTMVSNWRSQRRQQYSKIGMGSGFAQAPRALAFFCLAASRIGLSRGIGSKAVTSRS
jgi:hypothetical protein